MGSKKVDRWRHRAELVNQGASLVFLMCLSCISWMTARCTMPSSGGLPSNTEIAHVCAWYASSFPAWKRTCHGLPWLTDCSLQGGARLKHQNQYFEVCCGILILSATGKKWFRCLFWIARALRPIAERSLAHWRRSRCIDRFLGHEMTHESESVKSIPGSISQPIHLTLQTPSRSNSLIGEQKRFLQTPIVPKCKPMKSQIKGRCHRSSLKRRE